MTGLTTISTTLKHKGAGEDVGTSLANNSAPIADLIKTPSRTATAKKTRAMSAAKQSRADQVQKFNLALSPFKSPEVGLVHTFALTPQGRQPFSPLRVNMNAMPLSPTRSPLQARTVVLKSKTSPVKEKEKVPVKPKRGRPKKGTTAAKENVSESKENDTPTSPAPKMKSLRGVAAKPALAPKGKKAGTKTPPVPVMSDISAAEVLDEAAANGTTTPRESPKYVNELPTMTVDEPEVAEDHEIDSIVRAEPSDRSVHDGSAKADGPKTAEEAEATKQVEEIEEVEEVEEVEEAEAEAEEVEEFAEVKTARETPEHQDSDTKHQDSDNEDEVEETEEPAKPAGPIRHVRSSWLTQALGTNTVPLASSDRKSVAPSHRLSQQMDTLRQSHVAPGTLKRKSDEAMEDREESKRIDKIARFDEVATDASSGRPVSPRRLSGAAAGRLQGSKSLSAPGVSTPTSSFVAKPASSAPGDFESRIAALRERTAPPPGQKPVAPAANGAGFLGRLGNLVGISAKEEEAARAKAEADRAAQQNAEAELQRVLRELAEAEAKQKEAERATAAAIQAAKEIQSRSASPSRSSSRTESTQPGDVAIVVDDAADDMEVDDSVDLPSLPEMSTHTFFDDDDDQSMVDHGSALGAAGIRLRDSEFFATSTPVRKTKQEGSRPTSAMSSSQRSVLGQAEVMAGKVLGVRATPGTVKSLAAAEAAAKREQAEAQRRAQLRVQIEQKKQEEKQKALEAERAKEEEERRKRKEEDEERRRRLAKAEKARKEKMERFNMKNAAREQREAEARAKVSSVTGDRANMQEEAEAQKRKPAPTLSRSQSNSTLTKSTASSLNKSTNTIKRIAPISSNKEPLQASKSAPVPSKLGPSVFRTAQQEQPARAAHTPVKEQPVRPTLGPPVRTSTVAAAGASRTSTVQTAGPSRTSAVAGSVLQQSRVTLQAQLAQKALEQASEDIVLPDIASEYSDSDDEDRETDFKRPAWAESPELKQLLEMQQHVNPDELFGPIRPLSMEELFQARNGKFRARTSSANWSGQDRLTETEEREYARRMGFRPINAPRDGGGEN